MRKENRVVINMLLEWKKMINNTMKVIEKADPRDIKSILERELENSEFEKNGDRVDKFLKKLNPALD